MGCQAAALEAGMSWPAVVAESEVGNAAEAEEEEEAGMSARGGSRGGE
jgi:hypothetical protein